MRLFIIRVNRFNPIGWPALVPSNSRDEPCNRQRYDEYLEGHTEGDKFLIVDTVSSDVDAIAGRILALVSIYEGEHFTENYIAKCYLTSEFFRDEEWKLRKPYCLPYKEAIVFDDPPKYSKTVKYKGSTLEVPNNVCKAIDNAMDPKNARDKRFEINSNDVTTVIRYLETLGSMTHCYSEPIRTQS